jgi:hypothetical protein
MVLMNIPMYNTSFLMQILQCIRDLNNDVP